jgi:uncharacterized C2H2 Zn-finger protein
MEEVWVKCPECGNGFDNYPELVAHLQEHLEELKRKVKALRRDSVVLNEELLAVPKQKLEELLK